MTAVLVLAGAAGRVLGAGVGLTKELAVFATFVAAVGTPGAVGVEPEMEDRDLAALPGMVSFACPSLASEEEDEDLLGGTRGCLGACSGADSASELGWLPVEPMQQMIGFKKEERLKM